MRSLTRPAIILLLAALCAPTLYAAQGDLAETVKTLQKEIEELKKAQIRIGVIDEQEAVQFLQEWEDRKTELRADEERFNADLKHIGEQITKLENSVSLMVPGDEMDKKKIELQQLKRNYRAKGETGRETLMKRRDHYVKRLQTRMSEVVDRYAKEHNFSVILFKVSFVYQNKTAVKDITDDITQIMNEEYTLEKTREVGEEPKKGDTPAEEPEKNPEKAPAKE